ncbi:MAG: hypothetical protein Q8M16_16790 [Pirellulaceae bacterium]|nr:hypothetical protein [Pirellulaceae bacterium]
MIPKQARHRRFGYSLIEIAVALPTIGILTVGMCSAVLLSVRAIPQGGSVITASVETARAMEQLERDLRCATQISKRESRDIVFSVPDRTGNGQSESIRYWWSGVDKSAVYRQINNGPSEIVVEQTSNFSLAYDIQPRVTNRVVEQVVTSNELLLASFEGWPGVTASTNEFTVGANDWIGSTFQLSDSVPRNYSKLRFTRASVYGRRDTGSGMANVGVYRVTVGREPRLVHRFGSLRLVASNLLPVLSGWADTTLANDVVVTDGSRTFYLMFSATAATSTLRASYYSSNSAPVNVHPTCRWTTDSGTSWLPGSSDLHKNDLLFRIYGTFETVQVSSVPETKQHIQAVQVQLQSATNKSINIDTSIRLLNEPEATQDNAPNPN